MSEPTPTDADPTVPFTLRLPRSVVARIEALLPEAATRAAFGAVLLTEAVEAREQSREAPKARRAAGAR